MGQKLLNFLIVRRPSASSMAAPKTQRKTQALGGSCLWEAAVIHDLTVPEMFWDTPMFGNSKWIYVAAQSQCNRKW